ncbi:hypothetical protein [Terrihabitans rhizophilus]|uniref:Uncharacterized protein n=1 Tax=Terrihabitans rhizophilus TaxID=3092662 RepID=A0ABU4RRT0_9HYPH|nr:hypothetical protein [Terrihabitans sp. PJ23]MDX6806340.1 hypothetical protein [Terrihabitans sp. PJ23]
MTVIPRPTISDIALAEFQSEPRAKDTDLGRKLGMPRPRGIRELIKRHRVELEAFGDLVETEAATHGGTRRTVGRVYWLNEEQALLISTKSDAPLAAEVRQMLIRVFVAFRRGHLVPALPLAPAEAARAVTETFGAYFDAATRFLGLDRNQAALCADRATKAATGVTMLGAMGVNYLEAPNQSALVTPTRIGQEIGHRTGSPMSARKVNLALMNMGLQILSPGGTSNWEPTEKGKHFGGRMVDVPRANTEGNAQQLLWPLSVAQIVFGAVATNFEAPEANQA